MRHVSMALAVLLAACTDRNAAAERRARLDALVGRPEAALIGALGPPSRREDIGGHEFLTYERTDTWPGRGVGAWSQLIGPGPHPTGTATFRCQATFTVVAGIVTAYGLRGNGC